MAGLGTRRYAGRIQLGTSDGQVLNVCVDLTMQLSACGGPIVCQASDVACNEAQGRKSLYRDSPLSHMILIVKP